MYNQYTLILQGGEKMTQEQRDEILLNLQSHIIGLDSRFTNLETRFDRLDDKMDKLEDKMDKLESRMDNLEDKVDNLEKSINYMQLMDEQRDEKIAALLDGQKINIQRLDSHNMILEDHSSRISSLEAKVVNQ